MCADARPAEANGSTPIREGNERVRRVRLRTSGAALQHLPGGAFLVKSDEPLGPYPKVLTDRLVHWAKVSPDRTFAAKRQVNGDWRRLTYSSVLVAVRSIGQALLDRELSADRPVVILSENDLEHLVLMLAGQHVGIPTAHLSPVYSLVSKDFTQLRHILSMLTPGLVFVSSAEQYRRAIEAAVEEKVE